MTNYILAEDFVYKTNLKKRIVSTLVDYSIYLLFFFFYVNYFGHDNDEGGKTVDGLLALPVFAVWFIYFVVVEAVNGATLGHNGVYLKVLTIDRAEISFGQAIKRHLLDPIDILMYGIPALIAIKNSDRHQRLGDMWAKTIVVDTKDPQQYFTADTAKV